MALLEVADLNVRYGEIEALRGISFTVDEGKVVTLLGSNGAGKSTTGGVGDGVSLGEGSRAGEAVCVGVRLGEGSGKGDAASVGDGGRLGIGSCVGDAAAVGVGVSLGEALGVGDAGSAGAGGGALTVGLGDAVSGGGAGSLGAGGASRETSISGKVIGFGGATSSAAAATCNPIAPMSATGRSHAGRAPAIFMAKARAALRRARSRWRYASHRRAPIGPSRRPPRRTARPCRREYAQPPWDRRRAWL